MLSVPGAFQLGHDARDQFLGVGEALADDLDVHGWFAGLAGALAVDAVLAYQHQGVGQQIQGDGQTPALQAHAEFVLFKGVFTIVINGHASW